MPVTIRAWPRWLLDAPAPARPLPGWLASVPAPCTRSGLRLDPRARARLLAALDGDDETLARFESWLEPRSLREHAWALVEAWAEHGGDPRHVWVLAGLRFATDDELEERLVPACDPETGSASFVLQRELARLERALSCGRDWSVVDWRHWLLEHGLMRHVVPTLVWAQRAKEPPGRLSRIFRVDSEGGFRDVEHRRIRLDPRERVCLVHPIELSFAERAAWGDLVAELELIPPFAQLARPIHAADPADMAGDTLFRFAVGPARTAPLRAALRRRGWALGEPGARMRARYFTKAFLRLDTHAVLCVEPGVSKTEAAHRVKHVFFLERAPGGVSFETDARIALCRVAPIALSEVLYDLAAIAT